MALCRTCRNIIPCHCHTTPPTQIRPGVYQTTEPYPARYCTGDRCRDCTPDEECCEATCGCCPRVEEHDRCFLYPGSEGDSKYCDQHSEG